MEISELEKRFTYHHSTRKQSEIYDDIALAYFNFAKILNEFCPDSREQSLMFTYLEISMMCAFASVGRNDEEAKKT